MVTVAVEGALSEVAERLRGKGYRVVDPETHDLADVAAVIITGGDERVMGISDPATDAPVISARGKDVEDILAEVEARLRLH